MRRMEEGCVKAVGDNSSHEVGDFMFYGISVHNRPEGPFVKGIDDHICLWIDCLINRRFIDFHLFDNNLYMWIKPSSVNHQGLSLAHPNVLHIMDKLTVQVG